DGFRASEEEPNAWDPMERSALFRLLQQPQSLEPSASATRQMADYDGRVKHLALMLSGYVGGQARTQVLEAYKTLFNRMEPDTKFTIMVDGRRDRADVQKAIADSGCPNPERIHVITPPVDDLTVWARDMMVGLEFPGSPERNALVAQKPLHDWHGNDREVPGFLSKAVPGLMLNPARRLVTDGGDTTSNRSDSFVGYYSIAATAERLQQACSDASLKGAAVNYFQTQTGKTVVPGALPYQLQPVDRGDLHRVPFRLVDTGQPQPQLQEGQATEGEMYEWLSVKMFEREFGKPVTVLGKDDPETEHQEEPATDHMDMGFTPISDREVLLGDPELARQLINEMTPAERSQAEARMSELAGHPVDLDDYFGTGPMNRDNPLDFANYKKIAEGKGLEVTRLPHLEPGFSGSYISYNNCLMERFTKDGQEVRRVFLPVYGIEKLDDYATSVWQSKGFEVIPMPLGALSTKWGALRCISNWLERSPTA
ncbi:MAG: hypothetical protein AB1758_17915, partial [Candidatus Eremiobacterota bacterium]